MREKKQSSILHAPGRGGSSKHCKQATLSTSHRLETTVAAMHTARQAEAVVSRLTPSKFHLPSDPAPALACRCLSHRRRHRGGGHVLLPWQAAALVCAATLLLP